MFVIERKYPACYGIFILKLQFPFREDPNEQLFQRTNENVVWDKPEKKHSPIYITPMAGKKDDYGGIMWSPYTAADQSAQVAGVEQVSCIF